MKYTDRGTALTQERGAVGSGLILITFQQTSQGPQETESCGLEQVSLAVLSNRMMGMAYVCTIQHGVSATGGYSVLEM